MVSTSAETFTLNSKARSTNPTLSLPPGRRQRLPQVHRARPRGGPLRPRRPRLRGRVEGTGADAQLFFRSLSFSPRNFCLLDDRRKKHLFGLFNLLRFLFIIVCVESWWAFTFTILYDLRIHRTTTSHYFFSLVLEKGRRDTGRRGEREPSNLNEPQLLQSVLNMLVK